MSDVKLIRKQIRNVIQEFGPDLLANELYKKLNQEHTTRLNEIERLVKEALKAIDDRAKDFQSMMLRETLANTTTKVSNK